MNWLKGKKTYIAAILLALQSLLHIFTGDVSITAFLSSPELTQILAAFGLASLRAGVEKNT